MKHVEVAKRLFQWNSKNLVSHAVLKKSEIGIYFADRFQVKANGKIYEANPDNYFDFLNHFRSSVESINYDLHDFITDAQNVVIPLTAHIVRVDGSSENFEAILILKFDQNNKIILWNEVYIKL